MSRMLDAHLRVYDLERNGCLADVALTNFFSTLAVCARRPGCAPAAQPTRKRRKPPHTAAAAPTCPPIKSHVDARRISHGSLFFGLAQGIRVHTAQTTPVLY